MIQVCWRNVGSRRRNVKGSAESDGQGRNVPKSASVADCPVVATQLLNNEEDMMKEAYAQSIECKEPCEGRLSRTVL